MYFRRLFCCCAGCWSFALSRRAQRFRFCTARKRRSVTGPPGNRAVIDSRGPVYTGGRQVTGPGSGQSQPPRNCLRPPECNRPQEGQNPPPVLVRGCGGQGQGAVVNFTARAGLAGNHASPCRARGPGQSHRHLQVDRSVPGSNEHHRLRVPTAIPPWS